MTVCEHLILKIIFYLFSPRVRINYALRPADSQTRRRSPTERPATIGQSERRYFLDYLGRSEVCLAGENLSRIEFAFTYCASAIIRFDGCRLVQGNSGISGGELKESPKEKASQRIVQREPMKIHQRESSGENRRVSLRSQVESSQVPSGRGVLYSK